MLSRDLVDRVVRWMVRVARTPDSLRYRVERLTGASDELTPPPWLREVVGPFRDARLYREVGAGVLDLLRAECGLGSDEDVLDVGCGCGQMAAPLSRYLSGQGSYEGFDIDGRLVDWCSAHIAARHRRFHFQVLDVHNSAYFPRGTLRAADLEFPYQAESFDFAFAKSVMTHLLPAEVDNYIAQTSRVLRPGGRCWMSFFLLNAQSLDALAAGRSTLDFRHRMESFRTIDPAVPESAVALEEPFVRSLFEKHGLKIREPLQYGSWSGRSSAAYQDSVFAIK